MRPHYADERVTLYRGDMRDVLRSLPDASVDFIFTDPPCEARSMPNEGPKMAETLFRHMLQEARRILKPGACIAVCCGGGGPDPRFARWSLALDETIGFKHMVVWDTGGLGMGWRYRRCYEAVLIGQKPGAACTWLGGDDTPDIIRRTEGISGIEPTARQHPTEKPADLAAWFIRRHAEPGDLVLDPFCRSGSTLVAAKRLGCRAIGVELDERWVEAAEKRLVQGVLP